MYSCYKQNKKHLLEFWLLEIIIKWQTFQKDDKSINPLKTSPEYTRAGVYGNCVL